MRRDVASSSKSEYLRLRAECGYDRYTADLAQTVEAMEKWPGSQEPNETVGSFFHSMMFSLPLHSRPVIPYLIPIGIRSCQ